MIKRHPIIYRIPIFVKRTAVFPRKPLCYKRTKWEHCKLCSSYVDCSGKAYARIEDTADLDFMRTIYVSSVFSDWDTLESQIWKAQDDGVFVRLLTDVDLPKEIVWALSYSEKNILQINFNTANLNKNIVWTNSLVALADRCGLYCMICMCPIVPGIVKTYHIISVLDRLRGNGYFHVSLKFWEIHEELIECDGWLNFNGAPLSVAYLERTPNGWKCTEKFKQDFMSIVQIFSTPRKISVTSCGDTEDCTGLTKTQARRTDIDDTDWN